MDSLTAFWLTKHQTTEYLPRCCCMDLGKLSLLLHSAHGFSRMGTSLGFASLVFVWMVACANFSFIFNHFPFCLLLCSLGLVMNSQIRCNDKFWGKRNYNTFVCCHAYVAIPINLADFSLILQMMTGLLYSDTHNF